MSKLNQDSTGPMHVLVDEKAGRNILTLKNLAKFPTAFQVQEYDDQTFRVHPDKGVLAPKQTMDLEMQGGATETRKFHLVAVEWPKGKPSFDQDVWNAKEKDKNLVQVIAFGNAPKYRGMKTFDDLSKKDGYKSSGPKLLQSNTKTVTYKLPNGSVQTYTVKVKNATSKPVAYKIMLNKGDYYKAKPCKGIVDVGKEFMVDFEMNASFTDKDYDEDPKGHEIHLIGIRWPKPIDKYFPEEWKRLEKARNDEKQRLILNIVHKSAEETAAAAKTTAEISSGPSLLQVTPTKMRIQLPLERAIKICLQNNSKSSDKVTVAFKMQTNKPKYYIMTPCKGVVKPGAKAEIKITTNDSLVLKDVLSDKDNHQILMIAVPWKKEAEKGFDNDAFAAIQKLKKKDVQRKFVDVLVEARAFKSPIKVFPPSLSFKPLNDMAQMLEISLVNQFNKTVAYKIEPPDPVLLKFYSIAPDFGVLKALTACKVMVQLNEGVKEEDIPSGDNLLKMTATTWLADEFNEDVWKDYENYKKDDMIVTNITIDFEGSTNNVIDESGQESNPADAVPGPPSEALLQMYAQLQQMQGMMDGTSMLPQTEMDTQWGMSPAYQGMQQMQMGMQGMPQDGMGMQMHGIPQDGMGMQANPYMGMDPNQQQQFGQIPCTPDGYNPGYPNANQQRK